MVAAPRRVPAGDELARLMRCYGYRLSRTGSVKGLAEPPAQADLDAARADGWPVHTIEQWTDRQIVDRVVDLLPAIDERAVLAAFVAGLGSAPRGRQTIISYGWARFLAHPGGVLDGNLDPVSQRTGGVLNLASQQADGVPGQVSQQADGVPGHGLEPVSQQTRDVSGCGLEPMSYLDVTHELVRLALGWSWNELPAKYLIDLEAAADEGLPPPDDDDRARLRSLLDLIRAQPAGTTPGVLEKGMARARIVPATDKYQRYGILIGLAELGVLRGAATPPSWDRFVPVAERHAASRAQRGAPRSDITLPLAAWRGGVDDDRAALLLAA